MCNRKYMFGDKFILFHAKMVKKRSTRKNICLYIQQGPYPSFNEKKVSHFTILLKLCKFLWELGIEHKSFLNII